MPCLQSLQSVPATDLALVEPDGHDAPQLRRHRVRQRVEEEAAAEGGQEGQEEATQDVLRACARHNAGIQVWAGACGCRRRKLAVVAQVHRVQCSLQQARAGACAKQDPGVRPRAMCKPSRAPTLLLFVRRAVGPALGHGLQPVLLDDVSHRARNGGCSTPEEHKEH